MRIPAAALLAGLSVAANASVGIAEVYPANAAGDRIVPAVGESYYIGAVVNVQNQSVPYRLTIQTPGARLQTPWVNFGVSAPGQYTLVWGTARVLFDGLQSVTVKSSTGSTRVVKFAPTAPAIAIEYFAPKSLTGRHSMAATFSSPVAELVSWSPIPTSEGFQQVDSAGGDEQAAISTTGQAIGLQDASGAGGIETQTQVTSIARSVRTNAEALRTAKMVDLAGLSSEFASWLAAEPCIQTGAPDVIRFAKSNLPRGYRDGTVFDAARSLYRGVLRTCTYGAPYGQPDALKALRLRRGDCGHLSAIFVAACRTIGIPARPVCGYTLGENQWHVWAEFFVPGHGWVPVDAAYAKGAAPVGDQPLYFGVIPELNGRVATTWGFQQSAAGRTAPFLQMAQAFFADPAARLTGYQINCQLSESAGQP